MGDCFEGTNNKMRSLELLNPCQQTRRLLLAVSILTILSQSRADRAALGRISGNGWGRSRQTLLAYDNNQRKGLPMILGVRGGSTDEAIKTEKGEDESENEAAQEEEEEEPNEEEEDEEEEEESEEEEELEEEEAEEVVEEEEESAYSEDEYDEEEEEETPVGTELEEGDSFDDPLVQSPMLGMYATFGVMLLAKKIDLYNPIVVRAARSAFIAYLVLLQIFLLYVRIRAKATNDRTPVTLTNPISNLVQSQLQSPDNGNAMMKNLASSFLSSESTILEYDLKQARSMQGGLLFNMAFMWLLHFKMEQIQPVVINTLTGLLNMLYSPLFQVYILGRNLERPFKNPAMLKYDKAAETEDAAAEDIAEATTIDTVVEEEETKAAEEDENEEEEEDSDSDSDSDDTSDDEE